MQSLASYVPVIPGLGRHVLVEITRELGISVTPGATFQFQYATLTDYLPPRDANHYFVTYVLLEYGMSAVTWAHIRGAGAYTAQPDVPRLMAYMNIGWIGSKNCSTRVLRRSHDDYPTTPATTSGNHYDWTGDSRGVGNVQPYGQSYVLTAGEDIRDGNDYDYNIASQGRTTTIVLSSTLNVACDVDIFMQPVDSPTTTLLIYSADDVLLATTGVLIFSPYAGGTGADSTFLTVAALASKAYRFIVRLTAASSPASGSAVASAYCA